MLNSINPANLICIDIETAPAHSSITAMNDEWKELWEMKSARLKQENENKEEDKYEFFRDYFYTYFPKYTLWPPEVHAMCYVLHEHSRITKIGRAHV